MTLQGGTERFSRISETLANAATSRAVIFQLNTLSGNHRRHRGT
jgi:hypothetical protein